MTEKDILELTDLLEEDLEKIEGVEDFAPEEAFDVDELDSELDRMLSESGQSTGISDDDINLNTLFEEDTDDVLDLDLEIEEDLTAEAGSTKEAVFEEDVEDLSAIATEIESEPEISATKDEVGADFEDVLELELDEPQMSVKIEKNEIVQEPVEDSGNLDEIVLEIEEPEAAADIKLENELEIEEVVEAENPQSVEEMPVIEEKEAIEDTLEFDLERTQFVESEPTEKLAETEKTEEELNDFNDIIANGESETVVEKIPVELENSILTEESVQGDEIVAENKNQFAELQGGFIAIKEAVVGLEMKVGNLRTDFENLEEKLNTGGAILSKEDRMLEQFAALAERLQRIENQLGQNKVAADKEIEKQAELEKRLVALELEAQDRVYTKNLQINLQKYIEKRIPENVAKILRQEIAILQKQYGE